MKININAGSGPQEISIIKRTVKEVDDAVEQVESEIEQLESEIAVKRGHWHKLGTYTVSSEEVFDFDGIKSGFAIINKTPQAPISIGNTGYMLYTDIKTVVCVDGMIYLDYSSMQKNSFLSQFLEAGGYPSIALSCPSGETARFDLYILD